MAVKTVGNTTKPATETTQKKTEYKFRYKATHDKFDIAIGAVVSTVILIVLNVICNVTGVPRGFTIIGSIAYVVIELLAVAIGYFNIYRRSFNVLTIRKDEIVYCTGWLSKRTTMIPAHKIRSCGKSCTWLQKTCKTMNIGITTAGDGAEIYFCNIEAGERAYKLISQMAKENGRGH